jgi:hypothetical protein
MKVFVWVPTVPIRISLAFGSRRSGGSAPGRVILRKLPEKAGDAPQPPVGRQLANVDSCHDDSSVRSNQLPAEAELIVMDVDGADPAEAVRGEAGLHASHHLAEGFVT